MSALALSALIFATGFGLNQDSFLYFPATASMNSLVTERLKPWPSAGDFRGLIAEPATAARATLIVFHGNAGHAGHREFYADFLAPLGLRVILAEYPGYGPRPGELGERSLVSDAEQTIIRAHEMYGEPLLVAGESLGSGVACTASAKQGGKITGLLLITPWDRLASVASHHYPWLPVSLLLRDRYDSIANLAAFNRPIVVAIAEQDDIVPARFGHALYESLAAPKKLKLLNGAGHNDWIMRVDLEWWRDALDFLLQSGQK